MASRNMGDKESGNAKSSTSEIDELARKLKSVSGGEGTGQRRTLRLSAKIASLHSKIEKKRDDIQKRELELKKRKEDLKAMESEKKRFEKELGALESSLIRFASKVRRGA